MRVKSYIGQDARLAKEARVAGRSVQSSLDGLTRKMAAGNLNPGIGTHQIFNDVFETRTDDAARVYYRIVGDEIQILAKSAKTNQGRVISILRELYEK
jgi:hypothetical protein